MPSQEEKRLESELADANRKLVQQENENENLRLRVHDLKTELAYFQWTEKEKHKQSQKPEGFKFFKNIFSENSTDDCSAQISSYKKSILDTRMAISKQVNEIAALKKEATLHRKLIQRLFMCMSEVAGGDNAEGVHESNRKENNIEDINYEELEELACKLCASLRSAKSNMRKSITSGMIAEKQKEVRNLLKLLETSRMEKNDLKLKLENEIKSQAEQIFESDFYVKSITQKIRHSRRELTFEQEKCRILQTDIALLQESESEANSKLKQLELRHEKLAQALCESHQNFKSNRQLYQLGETIGFSLSNKLFVSNVSLESNKKSGQSKVENLEETVLQQIEILKDLQSFLSNAQYYCEIELKSKKKLVNDETIKQLQTDLKKQTKELRICRERLTTTQRHLAVELMEKNKTLSQLAAQKNISDYLHKINESMSNELQVMDGEHKETKAKLDLELQGQPETIFLLKKRLEEEKKLRAMADGKLVLLEGNFKSLKYLCEKELKERQQFLKTFNKTRQNQNETNNSTDSKIKEQLESVLQEKKELEVNLDAKINEIVLLKQNLKLMENQVYRAAFEERFKDERSEMAKLHTEFMKSLNEFHKK